MNKLILLYLLTLTVLLGINLKLFAQENNLFENKTDLEIKQLFAHDNYIVNEIYTGIHSDFKNQSIYTSKLTPTGKSGNDYESIETAVITDSSFSIILSGFEKVNSLKIIYTLKGEFSTYTHPEGFESTYPFVAFVGSNNMVYILFKDNIFKKDKGYKTLNICYTSFHQLYKPPSLKSAYRPFSVGTMFYIDEIKCSIPRVNQISKGY